MKRNEHPNPFLMRRNFQTLNGEWFFDFDDNQEFIKGNNLLNHSLSKKIIVPFAYQSEASGINDLTKHSHMLYEREFVLDKALKGQNILLEFNAVDYEALVFLNGYFVGQHVGGYTNFKFDVTPFLKDGKNILSVYVNDEYTPTQPRGKQYWEVGGSRCWYDSSSGIYQSVYLEGFNKDYLSHLKITPDVDKEEVEFELETAYHLAKKVSLKISFKGELVKDALISLNDDVTKFKLGIASNDYIDDLRLWSPENPNLYDVELTLLDEEELDSIQTYFGFRKISIDNNRILLNNVPLYQRLILDQGYFKEGFLTASSHEEFKNDIILAKQMGFNGARKHQKIEDPYFYYYADKLGFLVWAEFPSPYYFGYQEINNVTSQIQDVVLQLYNHPSIITWIPFNESWGIRKSLVDEKTKSFVRSIYYLIKSLDQSRLVDSNDGWEIITDTDFIAIHDYSSTGDDFADKYQFANINTIFPMWRRLMSYGEDGSNKPILLTEYGGLSTNSDLEGEQFYGYTIEKDVEGFYKRLKHMQENINKCPFAGICYTQLTDVRQERNGLLDINHKPKFDVERIRRIILNED